MWYEAIYFQVATALLWILGYFVRRKALSLFKQANKKSLTLYLTSYILTLVPILFGIYALIAGQPLRHWVWYCSPGVAVSFMFIPQYFRLRDALEKYLARSDNEAPHDS